MRQHLGHQLSSGFRPLLIGRAALLRACFGQVARPLCACQEDKCLFPPELQMRHSRRCAGGTASAQQRQNNSPNALSKSDPAAASRGGGDGRSPRAAPGVCCPCLSLLKARQVLWMSLWSGAGSQEFGSVSPGIAAWLHLLVPGCSQEGSAQLLHRPMALQVLLRVGRTHTGTPAHLHLPTGVLGRGPPRFPPFNSPPVWHLDRVRPRLALPSGTFPLTSLQRLASRPYPQQIYPSLRELPAVH